MTVDLKGTRKVSHPTEWENRFRLKFDGFRKLLFKRSGQRLIGQEYGSITDILRRHGMYRKASRRHADEHSTGS
jgi:hypothetical protein